MPRPRTMPFLINPQGVPTMPSTKKGGARRTPPKGFRTMKAWMAHIRPGAKKGARSNPGGSTVAQKGQGRKASKGAARRSPSRAVARTSSSQRSVAARPRARRNPPSVLQNLPAFGIAAVQRAGAAVAGKVVARKGRALLKISTGGVMGMGAESLIGLVAGLGVAMLHADTGISFASGALQGVIEGGIAKLRVPFLSDALGADDYYLGYSDAIDAARLGELGDLGDLGGYVSGPVTDRYAPLQVMGDDRPELGEVDSGSRWSAGAVA